MKLSTPVHIPESTFKISHESPITLIGSCFAESIGDKLVYYKFKVCKNPFGIIYNPISVANSIARSISNRVFKSDELIQFNEQWISFSHHGSFSNLDQSIALNDINGALTSAHESIKNGSTLIVTFGSAWVYEYDGVGIVANCHKIPAKNFTKRLLSVKEILTTYQEVISQLKEFNPKLNILFTISPVRHSKDGLHENNLSKSTLHLVIHHLVDQHAHCHYFPAYELVIDELRDYRFFKEDMVHPTNQAVNYVWDKFGSYCFNESTTKLNEEIAGIQQALHHRPFDEKSQAHQKFIANTNAKITELTNKHPFLQF